MARLSGFGSLLASLAIGCVIVGGGAVWLLTRFPSGTPAPQPAMQTAPARPSPGRIAAPPPVQHAKTDTVPGSPAPATAASPAVARQEPAPAAAPPQAATTAAEPERFARVIVEDAGHLRAGGRTVIVLAGIEAPKASETCTAADGSQWPCGARARTALRNLIRMRPLDCAPANGGGTPAMTCRIAPRAGEDGPGGPDLALWLVGNGWARATTADLSAHEDEARAQKRGLWAEADEPLSDLSAAGMAADGNGATTGALIPPAPSGEAEPATLAPYPAAPPPVGNGPPATGEPLRLPSAPPAR